MAWWKPWGKRAEEPEGRRGYEAGERGGRARGFAPRDRGPQAEVTAGLALTRARARELMRNDPHAKKGKSVLVRHLVGTGIRPRPRTEDRELNKRIVKLWEAWGEQCQVDHDRDVYGLQSLAVGAMVESGEVLLRRRPRRLEDGLPVPVQLEVLEGDFLDTLREGALADGGRVVQGVEFDAIGRRRAYHVHRVHPREMLAWAQAPGQSVRVLASEVAHAFEAVRPGQVRGMPWASAVVLQLRDIGEFRGAEIVRKKVEAATVGVVYDEDESAPAKFYGEADEDPSGESAEGPLPMCDRYGRPVERATPGSFVYAPPGRRVQWNNPTAIGGYSDYLSTELRSVAVGMDVPYELLTGDLSKVNFSSARVGLNHFRAVVEALQWHVVIPLVCRPLWRWFVTAAQAAGQLPPGPIPVEWTPPAWPTVNPLQDAQATLLELRMGVTSLSEVVGGRGWDLVDLVEQIKQDNALLKEYGLAFIGDPVLFNKAEGVQSNSPGDPSEVLS